MSNYDNGFDKAQRAYDNMMPEEGPEPVECEECGGTGMITGIGEEDVVSDRCPVCKGEGEIIPEPEEHDYDDQDE